MQFQHSCAGRDNVMHQPRNLWSEQRGNSLAEYALLLVLIAGTAFTAMGAFTSSLNSLYSTVTSRVSAAMEHSFSVAALSSASSSPLAMAEPYDKGNDKGKDKGADKGKKEHGAPAAAVRH
jgi:Flp pilus assembly pilin Flp